MSPIITAILALLAEAPTAITQVEALWATVRHGASAPDQTTVDGLLAVLNPKVDADTAALHLAALAGATA